MMSQLKRRWREMRALGVDARAATELSRLGLGFVPWTSAALRPAAMLQLLNEVVINERRLVVDLGAGVSTLYFARVLSETGGHLVSIEDDPGWAEIVRGMLAREGLARHVTIREAPLAPCAAAVDGLTWFDTAAVLEAIDGRQIDLLVVDGPKAYEPGKAMARLPAWAVLGRLMANRSAIVLDDIERAGETAVLKAWQRDPLFNFSVEIASGGMALCRRGLAYGTAI